MSWCGGARWRAAAARLTAELSHPVPAGPIVEPVAGGRARSVSLAGEVGW